MSTMTFEHTMAAHCESGTLSALMHHDGLDISEPMAFGVAGGIFFVFIKTPKMTFPVFDMRSKPGDLRTNLSKRLGIKFTTQKFRDPAKAKAALVGLLDKQIPTAVQVDMFYMDYIPQYMRVHFNAHFVTVVGVEGDEFAVSDCYYPSLSKVAAESLDKARFAKSDFAPRGFMFYPAHVPKIEDIDLPAAIVKGIKQAASMMVKMPVPFIGIKGMRRFAHDVPNWTRLARNDDQLSHAIMTIHIILEERGTGGGGFRFMYATFLQEAAKLMGRKDFSEMSKIMMANGDKWREISLFVARTGKNRDMGKERMAQLRDMIMERADEEEKIFKALLAMAQ
jgi:Domain of unknown function (DUF4872)/Butirosin biosynthesis protein H, N-terminal